MTFFSMILLLSIAGVANMMPIFFAGWDRYRYPIDCYRTRRGKRLFGDNKTRKGLIVGVTGGTLYGLLLMGLGGGPLAWYVSPLLAVGALCGDLAGSMRKRQRDIPSGTSLLLFDQIDYVLGAIVFTIPFVPRSRGLVVGGVAIFGTASWIFSYCGYLLKIKKDKP